MPETAQPQAEAPSSLTPAQGEAAIEQMLKGPAKAQARPPRDPVDEPEEKEDDDTPDEEENEDDQGLPPEVDKAAEVEEPDAAEEGAEAAGDVVEVPLPDGTVEIPLSDLPAHVMMRRDYTQKTQELAEAKKQLDEHWQAVQQERQVYAGYLPRIQKMLEQSFPQEPNWEQLLATNPQQYLIEKHRWEQAQKQYQAAENEKAKLVQLQQMDMVQHLKQHLEVSQRYLEDVVPGWQDERRKDADKKQLREYCRASGFTEEEIDRAYDPRLVAMGVKAMRWDALQKRNPQPVRRDNIATLKPGTSQGTQAPAVARIKKAVNRVRQTKSAKDGEAAIELMLNAGRI